MSRYDPPDPLCRHVRKGIVSSGGPDGAHAATNVCDRPECIADAIQWAEAVTHLPAAFTADSERK